MPGPNLPPTLGPVPRLTREGFAAPAWQIWFDSLRERIVEAVLSLQIATANGFSGSVAVNAQGLSTVTLATTVTGIVKGNGAALSAAVPGVDYLNSVTLTGDATGTINASEQIPVVLAVSGVTAGSYGGASGSALITVDAKGRVTAASTTWPAIPVGNTASRPVGVVNGTPYLDTDLGQPIWSLSTASTGWINSAGVSV